MKEGKMHVCFTVISQNYLGPILFLFFRVQTRRFKDATIAEAVVWQGNKHTEWSLSEGQRRSINVQIMEHILTTHTGITSKEIEFIGDNVEKHILRLELRFRSINDNMHVRKVDHNHL